MADLAAQKKTLLPYFQRAEEVQSVDPLVAYYCKMFAVEQGMKMPNRHPDITGLITAAVKQLEKEKAALKLDPAADQPHCEQFALRIFRNADKVDRAGRANMDTARSFYAATVFLDMLNQFGDIDADLFEKQRYAAWRAAEIRKAEREGRQPTPPPEAAPPPALDSTTQPPGDAAGPSAWAPPAPQAPQAYPQAPQASPMLPAAGHSVRSGSDSGGYRPAAPASLQPGTRVWFCEYPGSPVEEGTVGRVADTGYIAVALRDRIVNAQPAQVAYRFQPGDEACHLPSGGACVTVAAADASVWPPAYTLRFEDGSEVSADAAALRPPALPLAHLTSLMNSVLPSQSSPAQPQAPPPPPAYPAVPPPAPKHVAAPPAPPTAAYSAPPAPAAPPPRPAYSSAPAYAASHVSQPVAAPAAAARGHQPSMAAIAEAHKMAKFAVSSLGHDDWLNAVEYLNSALRALTTPGR